MQKLHRRYYPYFWSGISPLEPQKSKDINNLHPAFKLKRIIEYASFPDLLKYPFSEFKDHIDEIDIDKFWPRGGKREKLIRELLPYVKDSDSWEELFKKYINHE